jgi:hypothetical protein
MKQNTIDVIGRALVIFGTGLGILGGIINAISVEYRMVAIHIWLFSNAFLFIWAVGFVKGKWNTKMSIEFIALMYGIFTIFNIYASIYTA